MLTFNLARFCHLIITPIETVLFAGIGSKLDICLTSALEQRDTVGYSHTPVHIQNIDGRSARERESDDSQTRLSQAVCTVVVSLQAVSAESISPPRVFPPSLTVHPWLSGNDSPTFITVRGFAASILAPSGTSSSHLRQIFVRQLFCMKGSILGFRLLFLLVSLMP